MVLLSPSIGGLKKLLSTCEAYAEEHGLIYNWKKSELLVFKAPKQQQRSVPPISLNGVVLNIVNSFKYLGHIVTSDLRDDGDIERECRALSVKSNMLARRFARCTNNVKVTLFKAFCQSFYTGGLWVSYTQRVYNVLRVQFNKAFRMLLGLPWRCSASGMFAEARIRRRVACLSVFYRLYFGECAQVLHDLIPPAPFYYRTSRRTAGYHPYLVAVPPIRTKRFQASFIMRTAKEWNSLPASVFPNAFNPNLFKVRVNRLLLGKLTPS